MLRPRVRNDLKVVHSSQERSIGYNGPEVVIRLEQECMPVVRGELYLLGGCLLVPAELMVVREQVHQVRTQGQLLPAIRPLLLVDARARGGLLLVWLEGAQRLTLGHVLLVLVFFLVQDALETLGLEAGTLVL